MAEHLGPYVLRGELGRGAMAVVWRAWDPKLEREVAIKEPVLPAGTNPAIAADLAARFVREGKAAAALNHPGIVTIHAADVYDGRPAIVMELIDGDTLSSVLECGSLSPSSALAVLDQLLEAVEYAHSRGVVHRDIKPDNIFVTSQGRVKLTDFGIAHRADTATLTQAGTVMGTPGYMAPEQVTGQVVDFRADLFAIGVIGYELVTGRNPFGATDGAASTTVMYRIVHEPAPKLPPGTSEGVPADLDKVLSAATAKDPASRFSDATAFRSALHGGPIPIEAPATSVATGATVASAKRSVGFWAAAVALGVLLAAGGYFVGGAAQAPAISAAGAQGYAAGVEAAEATASAQASVQYNAGYSAGVASVPVEGKYYIRLDKRMKLTANSSSNWYIVSLSKNQGSDSQFAPLAMTAVSRKKWSVNSLPRFSWYWWAYSE